MDADRQLTMRDYGRVVLRRKWIVVAAVVTALLGALADVAAAGSDLRAEAQMLVEPRSGEAVFQQDPTLNVQNLERAIQTEIKVLEGQRVRERVQEDLGLAELPPEVNATPVGSTDVVSVTVRSEDPRTAQVLADAYVQAYTADAPRAGDRRASRPPAHELQSTIDELQAQIDAADPTQRAALIAQQATFKERLDQLQIDAALTTGGASVVQVGRPARPTRSSRSRCARPRSPASSGCCSGSAPPSWSTTSTTRFATAEDLEALTDVPVLAVVPVEPPPDNRPIALSEPHEFAVEIYRGLRTNVQFLGLDEPLRVIQVTSSLPGEGKTTTATNLAVVLAQAGNQVALVDADLRKPRLHEVFNTPASARADRGPARRDPRDGGQPRRRWPPRRHRRRGAAEPERDAVEQPDRRPARPSSASATTTSIVDSAPVLPVADAVALARSVDGVLLVAQANRTSKRDVAESLARLERVGATVFGIVLNRAQAGTREGGLRLRVRLRLRRHPPRRGGTEDRAGAGATVAAARARRRRRGAGERCITDRAGEHSLTSGHREKGRLGRGRGARRPLLMGAVIAGRPDRVANDIVATRIESPATTTSTSVVVATAAEVPTSDTARAGERRDGPVRRPRPPTTTVAPTTPPPPPTLVPEASLRVVVANATGRAGLAARTVESLRQYGYTDMLATDAVTDRADTVVYYVDGRHDEAVRLAAQIALDPARVHVRPSLSLTVTGEESELWLIVGADWP